MMRVGWRSLTVAVLGVVTPWVLGWGVGALVLPERSRYVHAFLGAALTATSVGITARVFQDLGRSRSPEARIILGAIDRTTIMKSKIQIAAKKTPHVFEFGHGNWFYWIHFYLDLSSRL